MARLGSATLDGVPRRRLRRRRRAPPPAACRTASPISRESRPDRETERRWLGLLRGADLVIGVHGSNLLLPTGLARASIELLPAERYGNALQATLPSSLDPVTALIRHRTLYGSDDLADLAPERVADVAVSVLRERERMEQRAGRPGAGIGDARPATSLRAGSARRRRPARLSLRYVRAGPVAQARPAGPPRRASASARHRLHAPASAAVRDGPTYPRSCATTRGLAFELETHEELERFLARRRTFGATPSCGC